MHSRSPLSCSRPLTPLRKTLLLLFKTSSCTCQERLFSCFCRSTRASCRSFQNLISSRALDRTEAFFFASISTTDLMSFRQCWNWRYAVAMNSASHDLSTALCFSATILPVTCDGERSWYALHFWRTASFTCLSRSTCGIFIEDWSDRLTRSSSTDCITSAFSRRSFGFDSMLADNSGSKVLCINRRKPSNGEPAGSTQKDVCAAMCLEASSGASGTIFTRARVGWVSVRTVRASTDVHHRDFSSESKYRKSWLAPLSARNFSTVPSPVSFASSLNAAAISSPLAPNAAAARGFKKSSSCTADAGGPALVADSADMVAVGPVSGVCFVLLFPVAYPHKARESSKVPMKYRYCS
eukprot:Rhum_TRINITY_DN14832_c17_g1::Rhum_TRINITY_DN14832_c17_g1_i1::g.124868::m.124868